MFRSSLLVFLIPVFIVFISGGWAQAPSLDKKVIHELQTAMRLKEYKQAIAAIDEVLPKTQVQKDYLLYMKALAQYYLEAWTESQETIQRVLEQKESVWHHKAKFLSARIYLKNKDYKSLEAIYAKEAHRLHAAQRKEQVARIYIQFAEALSKEVQPEDLQAPPPDYEKAYALYEKALELKPGEQLSEEIAFRLGQSRIKAKQWEEAVQDFTKYLQEYDPDWGGLPGRPMVSQAKLAGKHRDEVRYLLAQCFIEQGQTGEAREILEDFVKLLEKKKDISQELLRDSIWAITRTYQLPSPDESKLPNAISALKNYLQRFPESLYSVQAAYEIPAAYMNRNRTQEAIAAFKEYLGGSGYKVMQNVPAQPGKETPAQMHEKFRKEATYYLGRLYAQQKLYAQAIGIWQQYTAQFPDGPHWSSSQQGILDAEYQIGEDLISEKKYAESRAAWEQFMSKYPLDVRTYKILYTFGFIQYQLALESKKNKESDKARELFQKAISEWEKLVSKSPNGAESQAALFMMGKIYEEELKDLAKALATYRKVQHGNYYSESQGRIRQMTAKHLALSTERIFRTNETPGVKAHVRNIKKLNVRMYKLNLEEYFRKEHTIQNVEKLDLALIEPDKVWEVAVTDYAEYLPMEQTIEIPVKGAGVYAIQIGDDEMEGTTLLISSDLDVVLKSSRREALVYVQNMAKGEPEADVKVLVTDGEKVILEGKTNSDGVFLQKCDRLKDISNVSVFVEKAGSIASNLLSLSGLGFSLGLSPKGYVFTDRPAYKPGEKVEIKAIVRDVVEGAYVVPAQGEFQFNVFDGRGRYLFGEKVNLSPFGTLMGSFPLSANAEVGEYRIELLRDKKHRFQGSFQVAHLHLQKVKLSLAFPHRIYFRGEQVEATFNAAYYYGTPITGKSLRYTLPDGRTFTGTTDEKGCLKVRFDTTGSRPGAPLNFSGVLEAEGVRVQDQVFLARQGFSIKMSTLRSVVLSGEPVETSVQTNDAFGKPVSEEVTLGVYRKVTLKPDPVLDYLPWKQRRGEGQSEIKVAEKIVKTDPSTGEAKASFNLEIGGNYIFRASGRDRFGNVVEGRTSLFVSDAEDSTRMRIFSPKQHLKVGENLELKIHSRLEKAVALVTFEGETILGYRLVSLAHGFNEVTLPVGHEHFPNFQASVNAMLGNRFYEAREKFTVERELTLQIKSDKKEYLPGEKARLEVMAIDHLGRPVKAEISLALVDEALFALHPDKRTAIKDFFQKGALRVAEMRTQTSCTFAYTAKIKKVDQEVLREMERISRAEAPPPAPMEEMYAPAKSMPSPKKYAEQQRRHKMKNGKARFAERDDMKEEAEPEEPTRKEIEALGWWAPAVVTTEDGKAVVEMVMPEKITEWRLTAIGCTVETLVGELKTRLVTQKKFFVDLKLPQALQEGDTPRFLARIHNLTDYVGEVSLTLQLTTEEREFVQPKKVSILAKQSTEFVFDPITVPPALKCQIKLEASVPGKGILDALQQTLPVYPWGMEYADHKSGKENGSTTVFLNLPYNRHYLSRWMTVSIGPTLSRSIFDLATSPYDGYVGCRPSFGSMASDLLAYGAAVEYASKTQSAPGEYQKLLAQCRATVSAVVSSQRDDGGWGLHPAEKSSNIVVSARTLWGLSLAKKQGVSVSDQCLSNAVRYLKNVFSRVHSNDNETKALVQYSLSLCKEGNFDYANRLHRQRSSMNVAGLSYTALLLFALDKKEMAEEILDTLQAKKLPLQQDGKIWPAQGNTSWTANDVENTALAAIAYATVRPSDPMLKKAIDYLLSLRYGWGFSPYHARGTAVYALSCYFLQAQYARYDYTLSILVNDKPVKTIRGKENSPSDIVEVPAALLVNGQNRVDFKLEGNGSYTYSVTLKGFSQDIRDPQSWRYPQVHNRSYRHAQLEYKGKPINIGSSSLVSNLEQGQRTHVQIDFTHGHDQKNSQYFVVEEPLPLGTILVKDSIRGNFSYYEESAGRLFFYFSPNHGLGQLSYEVAGYAPGTYRVLPTIIRDVHNPAHMRIGKTAQITVLSPGEKSLDPYVMNNAELYEMGRLYFEDRDYKNSLDLLSTLARKDPLYNQREVARMLLWIYTEKEYYEAQRIVDYFEILKEKYAELYIPFDRILVIGKAYEDMKEYERAYLVYQATIEASFEEEAKVGGALEDQGEFLGSVDYMKKLWHDYHDSAFVTQAYFGISQALYAKLSRLDELKNNFRLKSARRMVAPPTREDILSETIETLEEFLSLYPETPQSDDAAFSLASAYLSLDRFQQVVKISEESRNIYKDSDFLSSFQYMEALGYFSMSQYEKAIEQARKVADGSSKDKDYATYILGQVYHAQGNPGPAISFYNRIADKFPDAREAVSYFERRYIRMPEITKVLPQAKADFELQYCNIKEVQFLVYRVDLMKLYLQQKNLSGITKVHLAGISPVLENRMALGDGKDYRDVKKNVSLPLEGEGAYLVICRGDDLFTSGLVLVTPLQLDVQEDKESGRVRVNVMDVVKKSRPKGIHVKVIGSASNTFVSGETDLRGIFIADDIRGKATAIAREKKNLYAFYRGETWIGSPAVRRPYANQTEFDEESAEMNVQQPLQQQIRPSIKQQKYDFRSNLEQFNESLQKANTQKLYQQMRSEKKGVQVDMAK